MAGGMMVEDHASPCSPNCPNLDFVRIEGGPFSMGSTERESEQPVHTVNVPSFEMMRTEVTVGMYRECVNAGMCTSPQSDNAYNWSS